MGVTTVAIVGIGCRFPGGIRSPAELWDFLARGGDAITQAPPERLDLDALYDPDPGRPGKLYARWGGFVEGIDLFDADFFGISPREARRIDPQQRLLLEVVWEALEDGGQPADRLGGSDTGVFVGISGHDYAELQSQPSYRELIDVHVSPGSATSIAANRVSYLLDLRGPSLAVDTACSSALTAVHLACMSLAHGECGIAIASAVNALLTAEPTIGFCKAGMLSPEGRCKPFDARADGYVRSEGAGAVVLKPLDRALADDDPIYAVIRATGVNQDGRTPGISVPNPAAQEALLRQVLRDAGKEAADVSYIEAHGTGTPVGDPREAQAIGAVMAGRLADRPCLVGSVKGNLGHLEAAAGIVGLIKAALTVQRRQITPTINFSKPNPAIAFDQLGLRVPTTLEPWPGPGDAPAVAGVNAFGFGGANAHALLEEPPARPAAPAAVDQPRILTLSARGPEALRDLAAAWVEHLGEDPAAVSDLTATAALRRSHHEHRVAAVGTTKPQFAAQLAAFAAGQELSGVVTGRASEVPPRIAFVFPGMGPQWWGMGGDLLRDEPVYADTIRECDRLLRPLAGWSLLEELTADEQRSRITEPYLAHVANFAVQVALAALWRSWGIVPDAVVGHSSGEMAAACVAGGLGLPDAVGLAYHRGRLQHRTAGSGGMLAAGIPVDNVGEVLDGYGQQVALAAVNGPASVTLSGALDALQEIGARLERRGRFHRLLPVSVPYHGPQMDALRDELLAALVDLSPGAATTPMVSTVTGQWQDGQAFDAEYWWRNVRRPVLFAAAVDRVLADGCEVFVEVSPHPVLAPAVQECLQASGRDGLVLPSLRRGEPDRSVMLRSLGGLHVRGRSVAWAGVFDRSGRCVPLPRYPWQRERHWAPEPPEPLSPGEDSGHPLLGRRLRAARPTWEADLGDPRLDYLDGHRVQGSVTFPGAGHVELVLAAARALHGDGAVVLADVAFRRLLVLAERDEVTVQCLAGQTGSAIEVHSARRSEPDEWTQRATAAVVARAPEEPKAVDVAAVRERCRTRLDTGAFYRTLDERHGLGYEGTFRSVTELWTGDGEAWGSIVLPDEVAAEGYRVHPALLDAAFQVLGAAGVGPLEAHDGALLPVAIARVELHAPPGGRSLCHARISRRDSAIVEGSITLHDEAGRVALHCTGLRLQLLEQPAGESLDDWLYEERWEPAAPPAAAAVPQAGHLADTLAPFLDARAADHRFTQYYSTVEPALNALTVGFIRDALRELGFDAVRDGEVASDALADRLGVVPGRRRFFARLMELAAGSAASLPEDLDGAYLGYRSAIGLVRASGRRLAGTLRGTEDAREWLVAGEHLRELQELYAGSPLFHIYLTTAAETVAAVQAASGPRPLRILEVGAGTGSATALILDRLPAGIGEYLFTDLSPFFLRSARERFAGRPELRTHVLDIEQPPTEDDPVDVIVAADVVHATADVRATLRLLRARLAPGGLLVLVEVVRRSAWADLVFGQLDGWWRATDGDLRPSHPLLGVAEWTRVLEDAGFAEAASVTDGTSAAGAVPAQAVLLATAPAAASAAPPARHWLVLSDRRGVGPEIAATLRGRGDACTLVWPDAEYHRFGADGIALSASDPAHWTTLLNDLDGVDGVISLWALDAPDEPSGAAALMAFQETSCGWLVGLLTALDSTGRTLPDEVWLVTAGAQTANQEAPVARGVAQAPVWGLGRVLRTEQGSGRCRLVDLGAGCAAEDVAALLAELDVPVQQREDEVAFRDGRRLARRLRATVLDAALPRQEQTSLAPDSAGFSLAIAQPGSLDTLGLRETAIGEPGPGEVAIRVVAAALNFRDVLVALGVGFAAGGQDPAQVPLGWECAGVVVACGDGVVNVSEGEEVVAIAAGAIGSRVLTLADRVAPKPPGLSFEEAATVPVAFLTARWALERLAQLDAGERVLIHCASGGVGLAAVQVARHAGAHIFATAGTPEKRAYLRSLGIAHVMDSRTLEFADDVRRLTGGEGVDVVLNALSGQAIDRSLELLRPYGRFIEIGKRDIYEDGRLTLAPFRRNLAYFAVDLQPLYNAQPALIGRLLHAIVADVASGVLQPLRHHTFDFAAAEEAFRLMAQARHIGKVVLTAREAHYSVAPRTPAGLARADAAYLITGGLGGFGLAVAAWLAREGAGHIVLLSRSGVPREEDADALDALIASPAHIEIVRGDVTDPDDTARVLDHVRRRIAPLRGVIHAAMVLDDALLGKLDYPRFAAVLAPKLAGAWNLHELTVEDDLNLFVLFSSISAVIGQPAQASYAAANEFLGALAAHRHACGRPVLTVDWGAISGVGYVARHSTLERRMRRQGLRGIAPDDACAALGELLRHSVTRMVVSSVDWSARATQLGQEGDAATAGGATAAVKGPGGAAEVLRARLAVVSAAERPAAVERYLLGVTARVLETTPERIDVQRRLPDLGIDSLMAVELRTALRAELGVEVPIVDLLEQLSVHGLAETVAERLDGHGPAH